MNLLILKCFNTSLKAVLYHSRFHILYFWKLVNNPEIQDPFHVLALVLVLALGELPLGLFNLFLVFLVVRNLQLVLLLFPKFGFLSVVAQLRNFFLHKFIEILLAFLP